MRALRFSLLFLLVLVPAAFAALQFPQLTGRVVDDAHILSPATVETLDRELADYERGTTNQVVVVTLKSLDGDAIEDYGYQLGRAWGIGQKDKNNGVLLIVAPNEHKVRIEVGYGLEGVLTDAISSEIVQGVILPKFRAGQMEQGVIDGTRAILAALGGQAIHPPHHVYSGNDVKAFFYLLILCLYVIGRIVLLFDPKFWRDHPVLAFCLLMSNPSASRYGSSGVGGSGWGGGFSGGGGGFGGGGASGSW